MPNYRHMIARIIKSRGVEYVGPEDLRLIDEELALEINYVCNQHDLEVLHSAFRYVQKIKSMHELVKLLNADQPDFENWVWNNIDDICKS